MPPPSILPRALQHSSARDSKAKGKMDRSRSCRLFASYLPDWIITALLCGLLYLVDKVHGYFREFSLTDTSIQHTYAVTERISMTMLGIYAGAIPAILILLIALLYYRSYWDWHNGWLGLLLSISITLVITTVVKVCVGRPRPDLIDRCQPLPGSSNAPVYGLATSAICTQTDFHILQDGFRSFPSGHSSTGFGGLGYLSLYLAGKMHLFDKRGFTAKAWISMIPWLGAALIAISRTMDYRHHATDVLTGAILGTVVAYFSYHQYYPPLTHPLCHKPYSPRIRPSSSSDQVSPTSAHALHPVRNSESTEDVYAVQAAGAPGDTLPRPEDSYKHRDGPYDEEALTGAGGGGGFPPQLGGQRVGYTRPYAPHGNGNGAGHYPPTSYGA